jgi:hypothetical protein
MEQSFVDPDYDEDRDGNQIPPSPSPSPDPDPEPESEPENESSPIAESEPGQASEPSTVITVLKINNQDLVRCLEFRQLCFRRTVLSDPITSLRVHILVSRRSVLDGVRPRCALSMM